MKDVLKKINDLEDLIGHTPFIEISFRYNQKNMKIYAKLEYYNLTGSIKDRIALYMLKKAYIKKQLHDEDLILEATSGNTGISFAAIGTYLGYNVHIYMPDWMSSERIKLLESYNAKLHLVSKESGGFLKCIDLINQCKNNCPNIFLPQQFSNIDNTYSHYYSTAPEIYNTLKHHHLTPSILVAGVGTGGTIMGIYKYLKEKNHHLKAYPLEPSSSPTLSTGTHTGHHRIQGISDEFIPPILDLNRLDNIISVDDGDSIIMAQKLSRELGLGVGISSGANFIGTVKALELNSINSVAVTVFADDNKKYLSTDLMNKEPIKEDYISPNIQLLDIKSL